MTNYPLYETLSDEALAERRRTQITHLTNLCVTLCNDDTAEMIGLFAETFGAFLAFSVHKLGADEALVPYALDAAKQFSALYLENGTYETLQ